MQLFSRIKTDVNNKNSLEKKIKEILSANDSYYDNFYSKYLAIDNLLWESEEEFHLQYKFKDESLCEFLIDSFDKKNKLELRGKDFSIKLGNEKSVAELRTLCEQIDQKVKERHLFFCPDPDKGFISDILSAKKGDIFSYNNRNSFVCVDDTQSNMIFKYAFSGDIKHVDVRDFERSDKFYIKDETCHDLKYMYSLAFDYKSVSTMRRKYDFKLGNGYYLVSDIEKQFQDNDVFSFIIGNCKLRLTKQNNQFKWYDSNGSEIARGTVALMFAWTKTVSADIDFVNEDWTPNKEMEERTIKQINCMLVEENTYGLLKIIADYSKRNNNYSSISFTGLFQNGYNFIPVTFAFSYSSNGLNVYKMVYSDDKQEIQESTEQEFIEFYKQRYVSLKNISLQKYENYSENEKDILFKELVTKSSNQSLLGKVSSEEKSEINSILNSYLQDKNAGREYIPIGDIFDLSNDQSNLGSPDKEEVDEPDKD